MWLLGCACFHFGVFLIIFFNYLFNIYVCFQTFSLLGIFSFGFFDCFLILSNRLALRIFSFPHVTGFFMPPSICLCFLFCFSPFLNSFLYNIYISILPLENFLRLILIYVHMGVYATTCRGQKGESNLLELKLENVSGLTWVLGTELRRPRRKVSALKCWAISQALPNPY